MSTSVAASDPARTGGGDRAAVRRAISGTAATAAALGLTAQAAGMPAAFTMAAALLVFAALLMWAFGPETRAGLARRPTEIPSPSGRGSG